MQKAIKVTGRTLFASREFVKSMPKGNNKNTQIDEVEVVFFKLDLSDRNGFISNDDLEKEFELRGLKPADLISVVTVNEENPAFADEKPHCALWKDAKGKWCYALFQYLPCGRGVVANSYGQGWNGSWWFAGVRK